MQGNFATLLLLLLLRVGIFRAPNCPPAVLYTRVIVHPGGGSVQHEAVTGT